MRFIPQIIIGGLAGWLATKLSKKKVKMGLVGNIVLGMLGAFVGNEIARVLGMGGVYGFSMKSLFVATIGASLIIFIVRKLTK